MRRLNNDHSRIVASPVRHIDPTTVAVIWPTAPASIIEPWWIEIPVDQAFWRVWRINSLRMRQDGYRVYKIDNQWRAFLVKPPRWHKPRGWAG
jgi:hypothetical protein